MFMVLSSWQSHCESSPGSFDECRMAPSGRRPKTRPDDLGCESACTRCRSLHPPSPFIIITQPESWYSLYRTTEGRRLSRPSWLVTYRDGLPVHRLLSPGMGSLRTVLQDSSRTQNRGLGLWSGLDASVSSHRSVINVLNLYAVWWRLRLNFVDNLGLCFDKCFVVSLLLA